MNEVLVSAGAASIILAVVGGGATAFGVEAPIIDSVPRQVALALVGVVLLGAAIVLREGQDGGSNSAAKAAVQDHRQEVLAACRALPRGQPSPTGNLTFDRSAYLDFFTTQRSTWQRILADLFDSAPPDALKDDEVQARRAWSLLFHQWGVALEQLRSELPARFDVHVAMESSVSIGNQLAEPVTRWERSMSRLAGAPCTPADLSAGG